VEDNCWEPVANQDLWKKLEEKLREMEKSGMLVQFWKIPREWNEADKYAKAGSVIILLFIFSFLNEIFLLILFMIRRWMLLLAKWVIFSSWNVCEAWRRAILLNALGKFTRKQFQVTVILKRRRCNSNDMELYNVKPSDVKIFLLNVVMFA
jgi:hypothetical protein